MKQKFMLLGLLIAFSFLLFSTNSSYAQATHPDWELDSKIGSVYKSNASIGPWTQMNVGDQVNNGQYIKTEATMCAFDQIQTIVGGLAQAHRWIYIRHNEPCQVYLVQADYFRPTRTVECRSHLRCFLGYYGRIELTKGMVRSPTQVDSSLCLLESETAVAYTYLKEEADTVDFEMWFIEGSPSGYCSKTRFQNYCSSTKSLAESSLVGTITYETLNPCYTSFFYSDGSHATEVALANFDARSDNGVVTLDWTTGNEIDNLGFNVYRSESQEGEYTRINTEMISAKGSSFAGASYSFTDENITPGATYYYKLEDMDIDGFNTFHGPVMAKAIKSAPTQFALGQNYPNPFNASTMISYSLKSDADVTLKIYNILGQEVKTLVNKYQAAGSYTIIWNGKDSRGNDVATGIYFYRIKAGDFSFERKMAYLK